MHIVTVANDHFFTGLWCTVLSLLRSANGSAPQRISVVDGGLSSQNKRALAEAVARHPLRPELEFVDFDSSTVVGIPLNEGKHPLTYARLCFPKLFSGSGVLYVDSDLLFFRDFAKLSHEIVSEEVSAAVLNEDGNTVAFDFTIDECDEMGVLPDAAYFNAGLLWMNLDRWRSESVAEQCFQLLADRPVARVDQSAINIVLSGKIQSLAADWNRLVNQVNPEEFIDVDNWNFVLHYTSKKPWLYRQPTPAAHLFEKFCSDTGLQVPERPQDPSPHFQSLMMQRLRLVRYSCLQKIRRMQGRTDEANAYEMTCDFWSDRISNDSRRRQVEREAIAAIDSLDLRPEWL